MSFSSALFSHVLTFAYVFPLCERIIRASATTATCVCTWVCVRGAGCGAGGEESAEVQLWQDVENSHIMPKQLSFGVFHVFVVILTCFESRVFKIFSARAFGARECLIAFIDGRRAQNQQIRESTRLAYLGETGDEGRG